MLLSAHSFLGRVAKRYAMNTANAKRIALVLSGCGVYDGSEITEATSAIIHLSRRHARVTVFAPNMEQMHVINHATGDVMPEGRNVLIESARISRGHVKPLETLSASDFDGIIFPGGFGVAKNLSSFATDGADMVVNAEIVRVINEFIKDKKPLGFACISPILAARVIKGCNITLGGSKGAEWPYKDTIKAAESMGANVVCKDINTISVDEKRKVYCNPAYMKDALPHEVYNGICLLVDAVINSSNSRSQQF